MLLFARCASPTMGGGATRRSKPCCEWSAYRLWLIWSSLVLIRRAQIGELKLCASATGSIFIDSTRSWIVSVRS